MSFDGVDWRIWSEAAGFFQRFREEVRRDYSTISASWEVSEDGVIWEHDFDVEYSKEGLILRSFRD